MAEQTKSITASIVGVIGSAIAGPIGAILGTFLGSLTGTLIPGVDEFVKKVVSNLGAKGIEALSTKVNARLTPTQKTMINHDLQTAFRDSLIEAFYDLGGAECFPFLATHPPRDVPPAVPFFKSPAGKTLLARQPFIADQIKGIFTALVDAINNNVIMPLDPPKGDDTANVTLYLESKSPTGLANVFFDKNIEPHLCKYQGTLAEAPELRAHLKLYLFDRLILHLNECLKQRTPAWRAFNRIILESIQDEVAQISVGQDQIKERLDRLLAADQSEMLNDWSEKMAEFLEKISQMQAHNDEGFEELTRRVVAQHQELFEGVTEIGERAERIEQKVDRVLRYMSTGQAGSAAAVDQPTIPLLKPPAPGEPPYKGLQSYTENDTNWFFGRDQQIARTLSRLKSTRFLAIIGASGSGKSSLVRAGLIPALQGKRQVREATILPENASLWPIHIISPSSHPLEVLAASLCRDSDSLKDIKEIRSELENQPASIDLFARKEASQHNTDRILLVVDQFEEVFTLCADENERINFIQVLMSSQVAMVMIVLRADFYANCAQYPRLREAIAGNQEFLGPMNEDELRQAIEMPARKGDWRFEPGLVDLIVKDIGSEPGGLPLLSHALHETWKHRSGRTMTLESYSEAGGVKGAIARTADYVFNQQLDANQKIIAQSVFLRLANLGEEGVFTRRKARLNDFSTGYEKSAIDRVIHILVEARLLTSDGGTLQVAHEALLREWPRLRRWLEENREALKIHSRIAQAVMEWEAGGKDDDLLFRGLRLEEAIDWLENPNNHPNENERAFLLAGKSLKDKIANEREAVREKELKSAQDLARSEAIRASEQAQAAAQLKKRGTALRNALVGAGILAAVVTFLAVITFFSLQQARSDAEEAARQQQIAFARELAARSTGLADRDQDVAMLLAVEAIKISNNPRIGSINEAQTALYQSLEIGNFEKALRCHTDRVNLAVFSLDNSKIASSGNDGLVCLWDAKGNLVEKYNLGYEVYTALFSPDGQRVVVAGNSKELRILKSGEKPLVLSGHTAPVSYAEFNLNGDRVLSAGTDQNAILWSASGEKMAVLTGHTAALSLARFMPDGERLITADWNGSIRLWKTDGTLIKVLQGHTAVISSLFFSPDETKFVTGSWDGSARIWSENGDLIAVLSGHTRSINSAFFNNKGSLIVTSSYDNTARVWKTDGTLVATLRGHTGTVNSAMFSGDGQRIITASTDFTIRLWNLEGNALAILRGHSNWVNSAIFSPDSQLIVSPGWDSTVRLWRMDALFDSVLEGHTAPVTGVEFNPDGSMFLSSSSDGSIRLWKKDGSLLSKFSTEFGPINSAHFSPDGQSILMACTKNTAAIYSLEGKLLKTFIGHTDMVDAAIFSPDAKNIISISRDNTIRIWKEDGTSVAVLKDHKDRINAMAFKPGSDIFATVSTDGTLKEWNLTGKLLNSKDLKMPITACAYSLDGKTLMAGDSKGLIHIYSGDGQFIKQISAHNDIITSINWAPSGNGFASTSVDGSASLWNAAGTFVTALEGHSTWITWAAFSPAGDRLVTSSWDGTVHLWNNFGDVNQMVALARSKTARSLTDSECQQYLRKDTCP